jgi:predicted transcriptional regulator
MVKNIGRIIHQTKGETTMATLVELTAQLVSAHASGSSMTSDDLLKELQSVYNTLKGLEVGDTMATDVSAHTEAPVITIKKAFKSKDEVLCMICGKGFKTLKRHLQVAHEMKPSQYRKQFSLPSTQSLVAKNYSEQRKKDALDRGQGEILAKARAVRAAKNAAVPAVKTMAPVPAVKVVAPVPTVRVKAPVPVVKVKAAVPAKVEVAVAPVKTKKSSNVKSTSKAKK